VPPPWLEDLERSLADDVEDSLAVGLVVLASVAGRSVQVPEEEVHGATRRALLLLAAGGDPNRGLDLNGRAVTALASDLEEPARLEELGGGLRGLLQESEGLPHVSEALRALLATPDVAWRAFCCALLASELDSE
jgi:hypothetical protein